MGRKVEKLTWEVFRGQAWMGNTWFLFIIFAQNSITGYTQLQGRLGKCCSCGPKRRRKLHWSSRIKKYRHLLLILRHQVLLAFILWWFLSVLLLSSPFQFLNTVPPCVLLCSNPFCIPLCQAPQGQLLPSPALYSQCLQAPHKHQEMFALWKPDRLIFLMHQFQHVNQHAQKSSLDLPLSTLYLSTCL